MRLRLAALLFVMLCPQGRAATETAGDVFALYSNICLNKESGDLLGTRIALMRLGNATYAMYQESEGWPGKAQVFELDAKLLKASRISFDADDNGDHREIRGTISDKAIVLTSGGILRTGKLLRLGRVALPETIRPCR